MSYLLKQYGDTYTGTMIELDGVLASSSSREELTESLSEQCVRYLHAFEDIHQDIINKENRDEPLKQILPRSVGGKILEIVPIQVKC